MKKHIPTFTEFIAENFDATGFNPQAQSDRDTPMTPIKMASSLISGKQYQVSVDGEKMTSMIYQGQSGGEYVFNQMDHAEEPVRFSDEDMSKIIANGGVSRIADDINPSKPSLKIYESAAMIKKAEAWLNDNGKYDDSIDAWLWTDPDIDLEFEITLGVKNVKLHDTDSDETTVYKYQDFIKSFVN